MGEHQPQKPALSSMLIVCDGCGARFRMNHAHLQGAKGARIRCRKCGGHIEVRLPEVSPVPPAPEVPCENPLSHAPSSDALLPPAKPEVEMGTPLPEEPVFTPCVPVADTAAFSSGDHPYDVGPHLAGVPGGETSDVLEESPTFPGDISGAVRTQPVPSPPDEQAIPPVSARIEAEPEPEPVPETELELVDEAELEPIAEAHVPTELEPPVEAQANVPTFEPGDAVPEEEPAHAHPSPRMETFSPIDAPDAALAINCNRDGVNKKIYTVYRIGYWNNKLELIGKVVERRKEERNNNAVDMLRWAQKIYAASSIDSNIFIVNEDSSGGAIFGGA
jgi:predicted Zn finger-like uncharacterized protein